MTVPLLGVAIGGSPSAGDAALLLLRLVLGGVMAAHGVNHAFGGGRIPGTARWFEGLGMRPGELHAWTASLTEMACGVLVAAGTLTAVACAGIVGVMVVAWVTAHRTNGFFVFRPGQGWEYVAVLTVLAVVLATLGPGAWSIDAHVGAFRQLAGWDGAAIAAGAGGAGAAGLLALCWRPGAAPPG